MRRDSGPAQLESDRGPLGSSRLLAHDERHGRAQTVDRELGGGSRVVTGPARGDADVLLVHPGVHDPDVHELAIRDVAHRARADLVEA